MLKKIIIRSFKSISNQEIPLGLMNVFIGANGSGKTNILEAIGVLSAAAAGRVDDEALQRRGVRPGTPRLYKSAFQERIAPHIFFEAQTDTARYAVSLNNPLEHPKPAWQYKTEELVSEEERIVSRGPRHDIKNKEQGLAALKIVESNEDSPAAMLLDTLRNFAIYAPNTPVLRGIAPDPQTRGPIGFSGGQLAEAVQELQDLVPQNEFIEDAFDELITLIDWMTSFDTTSKVHSILSSSVARSNKVIRFTDKFMKGGYNHLSAYDASEGALYILFCAVLALSPNAPRCVAVDNLDQALNPRLILTLTRFLSKWIIESPDKRQICFTAHNPAVLDGLALQNDNIRLFTVDRNNRGHTEISRVVMTEELFALSQQKGWPLYDSGSWDISEGCRMSDYAIGLVVEGTTDQIVIEAALQHILAEHTYTMTQLQPERSDGFDQGGFGSTGSGWGGVYQWCRQIVSMGGELTNHPALQKFDVIIIHLDADVAEKSYHDANISSPVHHDLPCAKPCPPADDSVQALKFVVSGWLDSNEHLPQSCVMCIPSKCTEAWVVAALYGQDDSELLTDIECQSDIQQYLAQKPARERLIRYRNGKLKKIIRKYAEQSEHITRQWEYITQTCEQADIFTQHIIATTSPGKLD